MESSRGVKTINKSVMFQFLAGNNKKQQDRNLDIFICIFILLKANK